MAKIVRLNSVAEIRAWPRLNTRDFLMNVPDNDWYDYDPTENTADDGHLYLKPDSVDPSDPGRWVKLLLDASDLVIEDVLPDIYENDTLRSQDFNELRIRGRKVTEVSAKRADAFLAAAATVVVSPNGDGDFDNIQDAVNSLGSAGGSILLREATYTLTQTVTLPNAPIRFIGTHNSTSITFGNRTAINVGAGTFPAFTLYQTSSPYRVEFQNIFFNASGAGTRLFYGGSSTGCFLKLVNCDGEGWEKILDASSLTSGRIYMVDCHFKLRLSAEARIFVTGGAQLQFWGRGTIIEDTEYADGNIFDTNTFLELADCSIEFGAATSTCSELRALNCDLIGKNAASVLRGSWRIWISNCFIDSLCIEATASISDGFFIQNCRFENNQTNPRAIDLGASFGPQGNIVGCYFDAYATETIQTASPNPVVIRDCYGTVKVTMTGSADYLRVLNTTLDGASTLLGANTKIDYPKGATFVVDLNNKGDYNNIQSAINALPAAGGTIYVEAGTYNITSTIAIPNKQVRIVGAGDPADGATINAGVKIDLGSNAIAAFTFDNGAKDMWLKLENIGVQGDATAGQSFVRGGGAPNFNRLYTKRCIVINVERIFRGEFGYELRAEDSYFQCAGNNAATYFSSQITGWCTRCTFDLASVPASPSADLFGDGPLEFVDCTFETTVRTHPVDMKATRCSFTGIGGPGYCTFNTSTNTAEFHDCSFSNVKVTKSGGNLWTRDCYFGAGTIDRAIDLTGGSVGYIDHCHFEEIDPGDHIGCSSTDGMTVIDCTADNDVEILMSGSGNRAKIIRTTLNNDSVLIGALTKIFRDEQRLRDFYHVREDFCRGEVLGSSNISCDRVWFWGGANGGAAALNDGSQNQPGKLRQTVTAVSDLAYLKQHNWYNRDHHIELEFGMLISNAPDATDDYDLGVGFFEPGTTIGGGSGVYFAIDRTFNTTNLLACCVDGGSPTRVDTGIALATLTSQSRFKIVINNGASRRVHFYKDDALVATITTNIPASFTDLCFAAGLDKQAGSNARYFDLDYIEYSRFFGGAR